MPDDLVEAHLAAKRFSEAFELLVSLYHGKVFRLAWSILGDRALAEDTAQDVFIRIWKALAGYQGRSSLSTWIFTIARNCGLTALRRSAARGTVSLDQPGLQTTIESGNALSPGGGEVDWGALIQGLPDGQRAA